MIGRIGDRRYRLAFVVKVFRGQRLIEELNGDEVSQRIRRNVAVRRALKGSRTHDCPRCWRRPFLLKKQLWVQTTFSNKPPCFEHLIRCFFLRARGWLPLYEWIQTHDWRGVQERRESLPSEAARLSRHNVCFDLWSCLVPCPAAIWVCGGLLYAPLDMGKARRPVRRFERMRKMGEWCTKYAMQCASC